MCVCLVDRFCSWQWLRSVEFPLRSPSIRMHMMKRSHQIIVNHKSRVRLRHNFQELGDLRERTHIHTLSLHGLQKQQEEKKKKKTQTNFSSHLLLFCVFAICLALDTNKCVVRSSRFPPLTALFCPSHDVCVWASEWAACVCVRLWSDSHSTSESFSCRLCFLLIYSIYTTFILHKTLPNKLILFTFSCYFSAACLIRICSFSCERKVY